MRAWQPDVVEAWGASLRDCVLPNVQRLLAFFRTNGLPVVHTRVGAALPNAQDLHPWRREVYRQEQALGSQSSQCVYGDPLHAILPDVAPLPGEIVLDKNASSAFVGSPIDFYLRNLDLQTLVVCGVATHACVQHTVRDAADRGYNVILVSDACTSSPGQERAHQRTLRVFGRVFGCVRSTADVLADLAHLASGRVPAATQVV
jgi:nicotinamidase-related amidase